MPVPNTLTKTRFPKSRSRVTNILFCSWAALSKSSSVDLESLLDLAYPGEKTSSSGENLLVTR